MSGTLLRAMDAQPTLQELVCVVEETRKLFGSTDDERELLAQYHKRADAQRARLAKGVADSKAIIQRQLGLFFFLLLKEMMNDSERRTR